jgi:hypothetical protein
MLLQYGTVEESKVHRIARNAFSVLLAFYAVPSYNTVVD